MRVSVVLLGTVNGLVLMAAIGVVVGERITDTGQLATTGEPYVDQLQHPHAAGGDDTAILVAGEGRGNTPAAQHDTRQASSDGQHTHADQSAPLEMDRPARVVAACESGKRLAGGTPVLGTHRWHITNNHGGTDSGAFQFLDSTWQRVAAEVGASQYARAKNAPPRVQLRAFRWLWRRNPAAWKASRSCWGPVLHR